MKMIRISDFNGGLPAKTLTYETGFVTRSYYHKDDSRSEAELFILLGEAIAHREEMDKAIKNLSTLLGVK